MKGETVSAREAFHKKFQIPSEFPKNSKTKPFKSITEPCTNLNTPEEIKLLIGKKKKLF